MLRRLSNVFKVPHLGRIETQGALTLKLIMLYPGYQTASHRFCTVRNILKSFRILISLF